MTVAVDGLNNKDYLPGPQTGVLNIAYDRIIYVHIGGFPDNLPLPKSELKYLISTRSAGWLAKRVTKLFFKIFFGLSYNLRIFTIYVK